MYEYLVFESILISDVLRVLVIFILYQRYRVNSGSKPREKPLVIFLKLKLSIKLGASNITELLSRIAPQLNYCKNTLYQYTRLNNTENET